jgi:hypothetical protein
VPGDPNPLHATFHQTGEKYDYIVLTYGRKDDIEAWPKKVVVDGNVLTVPGQGGVYVLDPSLEMHKATVSIDRLSSTDADFRGPPRR